MHVVLSYLEGAAGAALAESGDAVQIVGGDGLILLLGEAERREVEAGLLAIPVLQHGGELIYGAPFNKRRTSPFAHHTDTYRQCINDRKVKDEIKTRAPFGFRGGCAAERKTCQYVLWFRFKAGLLNRETEPKIDS